MSLPLSRRGTLKRSVERVARLTGDVRPEDYGAKGDGVLVYDGAIASGGTTLTCPTSRPFGPTDVGKAILIEGAGVSGRALVTSIVNYTNAGTVTVALAATTTPTDGIVAVVFGTDDTLAIIAADAAAVTPNLYGIGSGSVIFDSKIYCVAGPLRQGGAEKANAQIPLPLPVTPFGATTLAWRGARDPLGTAPGNMLPGRSTMVVSMLVGASYSATYGIPSVVGGPTTEQATKFSALLHDVQDITLLLPRRPSLSGFNAEMLGGSERRRVRVSTLEPYFDITGAPSRAPNEPAAAAIIDPKGGNPSGSVRNEFVFIAGFTIAVVPGEWSDNDHIVIENCQAAIGARSTAGITAGWTHPARFGLTCVQDCPHILVGWDPSKATATAAIGNWPGPDAGGTSQHAFKIEHMSIEDMTDNSRGATWTIINEHILDLNNNMRGEIQYTRYTYQSGAGFTQAPLIITGAKYVGVSALTDQGRPGSPAGAPVVYNPTPSVTYTPGNAWGALDGVNLVQPVLVPQTGKLRVDLRGFGRLTATGGAGSQALMFGVDKGDGTILAFDVVDQMSATAGSGTYKRYHARLHLTGLTPGPMTLRWMVVNALSTGNSLTSPTATVLVGQSTAYGVSPVQWLASMEAVTE